MIRLAAALAFAAMLVGGCGSENTGPGRPAERADVEGRQYVAVRVSGADFSEPSKVTLAFGAGRVSASGGCNSTTGDYTLKDGRLRPREDWLQTLMDCATADQDDLLNDLIDEGELAVRDDGAALTLSTDQASVTFKRQGPPDGPEPIEGPTWTAIALTEEGGGRSIAGPMTRPTLRIRDGRAEVFTGCSRGSAPARWVDGYVEFGRLSLTTRKLCRGYVGRVDAFVLKTLEGGAKATVGPSTLHLERGDVGVAFNRSPPPR